jgi:flagellar hook-associated protein FlgK
MDPISTARYGMMAATQQLTASANRVAQMSGGDPGDYATEAVNQIEAKQAFSANARVVHVADEMWKALLDIQSS